MSSQAVQNGAIFGFVFGLLFEWLYDNFSSGRVAFLYLGGFMLGFAVLFVALDKLLEFK